MLCQAAGGGVTLDFGGGSVMLQADPDLDA
jgi:hypothetical protein